MSVLKKSGQGGETIIAEGVKVEGDFTSQGNVIIEGNVSGHVATSGNMTVGERARIEADVSAQNAFIAGTVKGNVKVAERLELSASARVEGDVEARVISMAAGCHMNGRVAMSAEGAGELLDMRESEIVKA